MLEAKNKEFAKAFLTCLSCHGAGCRSCHSLGGGLFMSGHFFYWSRGLSAFSIYLHKVQKALFQIFNVLQIAFGAVGILSVMYVYFLYAPNYFLILFFLSVLTDAYFISRIVRRNDTRRMPEVGTFKGQAPGSWADAMRLPRRRRHDVSHFFNDESIDAVESGWEIANRNGHGTIEPLHVFGGLFTKGTTNTVFARLKISRQGLVEKIKRQFAKMPPSQDDPNLSLAARRAVLFAFFEGFSNKQEAITPTNLLLGIFLEDKILQDILYEEDVDFGKMEHVIEWLYIQDELIARNKRFASRAKLKPKTTMDRAMTALSTPALDVMSRDLTVLAKYGYMGIVVGRKREMEELFRVIESGRRSVILVGNRGVGKRALIDALAQRMVSEDVPKMLQDKRLVGLSVAKLIAGASPSEAQGRMMRVMEEVQRARNVILVIEGIEDLMGITVGGAESLDLSEVLSKFVISSRAIVIATATPSDYTRFVEGSALGEALHQVKVDEPTVDETIHILEAKVPAVEYQHKVYFSYGALESAAKLAARYIHSHYLPEKAVLLVEEAAVYVAKERGEKSMVGPEDVEHIVSEKTKIPVSRVTRKESEILLNMEERIHEYMVDQNEAVTMVAQSLRRARAQLRDQGRPIVNLMFLGPTGVGKTELAKTVSRIYFGGEAQMIRLDMSEYQNKDSVYRMIGAPPGTGEEGKGYLTEAVRANPFSLLLLDEMEKAHPDILNVFLQVMDDGRLTDSEGRTIDFTNVILIATSNAGTQYIQDEIRQGTDVDEITEGLINNELKSHYRPEFLNRFDGIVVFKPLSMEDVSQIAKLFLGKVEERLEKQGIALEYTADALKEIAAAGYSPEFGARPLRRAIQEHLDDELSRLILSGQLVRRDTAIFQGLDRIKVKKAVRL